MTSVGGVRSSVPLRVRGGVPVRFRDVSVRPAVACGGGVWRGVGGTGGNRPSVDDPRVLAGEVRVAHCRCQLGRRPPLCPAVRGLPCPRPRAVPPALYLPVSVTLVPVLVARCRSPSRSPSPAPGRLQRRAPPPTPGLAFPRCPPGSALALGSPLSSPPRCLVCVGV